jgi:Ca2+-binding EF-hand superfamily protein
MIFSCCVFEVLAAWGRPTAAEIRRRNRVKANKIKKAKKYEYIKTHDYNNDGKVDVKDRLRWVRRVYKDGNSVLVSTENEDLLDVMDSDGNGTVEMDEIKNFYMTYDANNDGKLDDWEIEQAE